MKNKEQKISKTIIEQVKESMLLKLKETKLFDETMLKAIESTDLTKKDNIKRAITSTSADEAVKTKN